MAMSQCNVHVQWNGSTTSKKWYSWSLLAEVFWLGVEVRWEKKENMWWASERRGSVIGWRVSPGVMGDFFARLQLVIFWWSSKLILEDILQQRAKVETLQRLSSHSKIQLHILNIFLSISSPLPRTGDINININVWSPPSLGGSRRLQWWRLDMTTQSVIHNIHSLLSSLSAQSAITAPGRRHVSHVRLCWTK